MTMAQTSLIAYRGVRLQPNEKKVLDVVKELAITTNEQIADTLFWEEKSVTGRTNSLKTKGLIRVLDKKGVTKSGNPCQRLVVVDPNDKKLKQIAEQECGV